MLTVACFIRSNEASDGEHEESDYSRKRREASGNTLLNDREEKIDKRDSDQPAFLRKIMD